MRRCRVLEDYAYFIKLVQDYAASEDLDDALTSAMSQCINEGVLSDYLQHNWSQITHTVLSEYAEAKTMRQLREEAIREGYDTGYDTGYDKGRNDGYDKGHSDPYDEGRDQGAGEERQSILARIRDKIANGSMTVQDAYDLGFTKQEV